MFAGLPFAFTRHLDPGAVDKKMLVTNPALCLNAKLNNTFSVRKSSMALSEKSGGRPSRLREAECHSIPGSNQISKEPRCRSAAVYSLRFVVRYFGVAGIGIHAAYLTRLVQGIPPGLSAAKPCRGLHHASIVTSIICPDDYPGHRLLPCAIPPMMGEAE